MTDSLTTGHSDFWSFISSQYWCRPDKTMFGLQPWTFEAQSWLHLFWCWLPWIVFRRERKFTPPSEPPETEKERQITQLPTTVEIKVPYIPSININFQFFPHVKNLTTFYNSFSTDKNSSLSFYSVLFPPTKYHQVVHPIFTLEWDLRWSPPFLLSAHYGDDNTVPVPSYPQTANKAGEFHLQSSHFCQKLNKHKRSFWIPVHRSLLPRNHLIPTLHAFQINNLSLFRNLFKS